ncbi:MFS transporter [Streptomyces sp. NBC_00536]|uniref:MFS transporter n=1 Tax=Streptomyces sp. NBC_00536 TaxID=2975769 RepID=UPI002E7FEF04|nr:MFS transporter [Streptomyces sp. NBC_00536]WUC79588.1 MFS transporter [Streptomyces sp. NBC_00536]
MTSTAVKDVSGPAPVLPRGPGVVWFGLTELVKALGTGFFYPFSLLFFTELSGESLRSVGLVLTVTALAVLPGLFAVGRLVDRIGPKPVLIAAALLRVACFAGIASFRGLVPLVVCTLLLALGNRAEQAASPLLAIRLAPQGQSGQWLALTRVAFNAGIGAGALLASLFIVDTASGFMVLGIVNAAGFALTALLYLRVPPGRPTEPAPRRGLGGTAATPWRNLPFLRAAGANALLLTAALAVESALPVFVLRELRMPSWTVGVLFAVNTMLLTVLQLPLSRVLERFRPGLVLAVGGMAYVALYASALLAGGVPRGAQVALLVTGMALYTLGELAVSQAAMVLLTSLPPQREQGAHLAFNQLFAGGATALAPLLVATLLAAFPLTLWWVLAAGSVLAALLAVTVPRVRERTDARPPGAGA